MQSIKNYFLKRKYPYKTVCPTCNQEHRYMRYGGMSQLFPHFYCNKCSNVIRRKVDFEKVMKSEIISESLLQEISSTLPKCPCGGNFQPGTNPKCPHCKKEIPHQNNAIERLTDPYLIVIQGAKAYFVN